MLSVIRIFKQINIMKKTFLEYYKQILCKVSFDINLLKKEYQKAVVSLNTNELLDLNHWLENKGYTPNLLLIKA
jgi:hypothetical protein